MFLIGTPMDGSSLPGLLALALVLGALWLASRALRREGGWFTTVHEWEYGLLYRRGRFVRVLPAGRYFAPPFGGDAVFVLRRTDTMLQIFPVEVTSRDNLAFRLSGTLTYQVIEPKLAYENPHVEQARLAASEALSGSWTRCCPSAPPWAKRSAPCFPTPCAAAGSSGQS